MNISVHKEKTAFLNTIHRPEFFRLRRTADRQRFTALLASGPLFLHDEISEQLIELMKVRHPSRQPGAAESQHLAAEHAGPRLDEYGVWVYYPWNARLVHLLDEDEFSEVRTARNKYKITREEQETLSSKKVGVIGLSVGQSVAVCMAMERSYGEIRLADFDILELSNFNRIRTGVSNLGVKKAIATAREIAEIDPFLQVSIFEEGLHEENLEDFFLKGGKLDAVIDECDSVDMKIICRRKARELRIPVLMEASDRCTIDVERFDLDPSRPLLHGYIDHLDLSKLKDLKTNEEKVPYLAPMVGVDTMSVRLKASALEVGHSITTWPQLASAVVMGGGALADIWRRMALGQFQGSGRYFIDIEELIGEKPDGKALNGYTGPLDGAGAEPQGGISAKTQGGAALTFPDMHAAVDRFLEHNPGEPEKGDTPPQENFPGQGGYPVNTGIPGVNAGAGNKTVSPPEQVVRELISAAAAAPSGGNSQPWKWICKKGTLFLFLDRQAGYSYMNFRDTASYIALGGAIENLVLMADQHGLGLRGSYFPSLEHADLVAVFSFHELHPEDQSTSQNKDLEPVIDGSLANAIEKRHTNRKFPPRVVLPEETLDQLKQIAECMPGVCLTFIDDIDDIIETGRIIGLTDRYRILEPGSNFDFIHREIRWTEEEAANSRTGIDVNTLELRESELLGLKFIRDPEVISFISKINGGHLLKNASVKNAAAASVFGLLTVPAFSNINFLNGGRAAQRLWLKATQLDLAFHPMNVPLAYFARLKHDSKDLPEGTMEEVQALYNKFTRIFRYRRQREEIYLFRLFKADEPHKKSYRKQVDDILSYV